MKRSHALVAIAVLALLPLAGFALIRYQDSLLRDRLDTASAKLEELLTSGRTLGNLPAPANQIRELSANDYGLSLLRKLDESQERLAFDPSTGASVCIWNGPRGRQTLFVDPGSGAGTGLTVGMPSQVALEEVRFEKDVAVILGHASSAAEDENEVTKILGLNPGTHYEVRIKIAELAEADFVEIWRSGTPQSAPTQ